MGTVSARDAVRIHLLGEFRVLVGPVAIDHASWRLRKVRSLVKLLALAPGHRLHREHLTELLWPDLRPAAAANNFHQALHIARRAFDLASADAAARSFLQLRDQVLAFDPSHVAWIDVEEFEAAASAASAGADLAAYERALALYAGDLLPDDRYEEWAIARREALRQQHIHLLRGVAELHRRAGEWARAVEALKAIVTGEPADEDAHMSLMRLYARLGQRQAALQQFQRLTEGLRIVDAVPDPVSRRLHEQILAGEPSAEGVEPSIQRPVAGSLRQGQRIRAALRRQRTDTPAQMGNLPVPLSTFVGRERELVALKDLLRQSRLLTLTGPGGSGKTRLALELAHAMDGHYADGRWWVDLQGLTEPSLLPSTVASALAIREEAGRAVEAVLSEALRDRHCLLVLDNCEHLIEACSVLAQRLLQSCPRLQMLATSRERLGLAGEVRWPVPPLTVPPLTAPPSMGADLEQVAQHEAVALFETRSRAVNPRFALTANNVMAVAEICRRLDGLPLAIELAAGRAHVLSVDQIRGRLGDRFRLLAMPGSGLPRYRTLGEAISWSYRFLTESEQALFNRLSVFAGSFDLEAVHAVCGDSSLREHVLDDLLANLVDKSMAVVEETPKGTIRYRLLETIREYARERLREADAEAAVLERHRDWFLRLAEEREWTSGTPEWTTWLDRMEIERDNLRAAFERSLTLSGAEVALRLAIALEPFWYARAYWTEGRDRLRAASSMGSGASPALRAHALYLESTLAFLMGDFPAGTAHAGESRRLYREIGDLRGEVTVLLRLAWINRWQEDFSAAESRFDEALALCRELGWDQGVARALYGRGDLARMRGDLEKAHSILEHVLAIARGLTDEGLLADVVGDLGRLEAERGHYRAARPFLEEYLNLCRKHEAKNGVATALRELGTLSAAEGDFSKARTLHQEALEIQRELKDRRQMPGTLTALARVAVHEGAYAEAAALLSESLTIHKEAAHYWRLPRCLRTLAGLAVATGDYVDAAWLYAAENALRKSANRGLSADEVAEYDTHMHTLREALAEDEFMRARAAGEAMTHEGIVDHAVSFAAKVATFEKDSSLRPQPRDSGRHASTSRQKPR